MKSVSLMLAFGCVVIAGGGYSPADAAGLESILTLEAPAGHNPFISVAKRRHYASDVAPRLASRDLLEVVSP